MPAVALQYTQSLCQLGVGIAIALLYFVEYQVRICNHLADALEKLKPQLDTLMDFDKRRLQQAYESPIELMNKNRRNQSFKQHDEVEILESKIKTTNRKMWFHIHKLRRSSNRLVALCLTTGLISFVFLLYGTCYPEEKINSIPLLVSALSVGFVLFREVYNICEGCRTVEKTYRRRYIKEGERLTNGQGSDPNGLNSIVEGDEPGVVYYLQRQLEYRIAHMGAYNFDHFEEPSQQA